MEIGVHGNLMEYAQRHVGEELKEVPYGDWKTTNNVGNLVTPNLPHLSY